jgi:DegV family protein with EDD domain
MPHNTCIAVDACCDLPDEFIRKHNIRVLPIYLKFGGATHMDNRDAEKSIDFYRKGMLEKSFDAETSPVSAEEMSSILEQELVTQYDKVLAITIMNSRSRVYENIRDAVWVSQPKFKALRKASGLDGRFRIQVTDSNNLFTGQALLTYEAVRMLKKESANIESIIGRLEVLKNRVHTYMIPQDLYHLKNRAGNRGDKSDNTLNWLTYNVGKTLNIKPIVLGHQGETKPVDKSIGFGAGLEKIFKSAKRAIQQGLGVNAICMSYSGDLSEIKKEKSYLKFVDYARSHGIHTLLSVMSTTAAINVGPGCFSLSYAESE